MLGTLLWCCAEIEAHNQAGTRYFKDYKKYGQGWVNVVVWQKPIQAQVKGSPFSRLGKGWVWGKLEYYTIFGLYVWKTKPVFIFIQYQRGRRARGRVWVFVVISTEYCPCRGYYHLVPPREWPTLTQILPNLSRQNTRLRKVIPLNKCVGIALWDWELETCTEPLE